MNESLRSALAPVLGVLREIDPNDPEAGAKLTVRLPMDDPRLARLRTLVRDGVAAGTLAERESGGIRFGRIVEASDPDELSIDCVHMDRAGPGHTHPRGEIDLCFSVSGSPTFDGRAEGWVVYPAGSWHVPTVAEGAMDILYFLPGGAIRFEPRPSRQPS